MVIRLEKLISERARDALSYYDISLAVVKGLRKAKNVASLWRSPDILEWLSSLLQS